MRRMSHCLVAGIIATASFLMAPDRAFAVPITIDFTASFSSADQALLDAGFSSNTLSGSYRIDAVPTDGNVISSLGLYTVGGALEGGVPSTNFSFSDDGANNTGSQHLFVISISNGAVDRYQLASQVTGTTNAVGFTLGTLFFSLLDNSGSAFGSDALPLTAPVLADFPDEQLLELTLRHETVTGAFKAFYTITSLTLNSGSEGTVPEPSALALLSLGLVGLGYARRRWKKGA